MFSTFNLCSLFVKTSWFREIDNQVFSLAVKHYELVPIKNVVDEILIRI